MIRRPLSNRARIIILVAMLIPVVLLFGRAALRSGPLAPIPVTVARAAMKTLTPALSGIGTVEARTMHKIGPTLAGRILRLEVEIGDRVHAGQMLGEMDPIDLDDRLSAQDAALKRAEAGVRVAEAVAQETNSRRAMVEMQTRRQEQLSAVKFTSEEAVEAKRQELQAAQAAVRAAQASLDAAREELSRVGAEREALRRQRGSLRLLSPIDGIVTRRDADPGTTVIPGQTVIEIAANSGLWIHTRFDQQRAHGLTAGLPAQIVLRSRPDAPLSGKVARIEPLADAVTEEILAKIDFDGGNTPPIGELAEVTVALAARPTGLVVPNASIQRLGERLGVWLVEDNRLRFTPVTLGASSLEGEVQVLAGLTAEQHFVVYSQKALDSGSRITIVDRLLPPGQGSSR